MKRSWKPLALLSATVLVAGGLSSGAFAAGNTEQSRTFDFYAHTLQRGDLDLGAGGASPGDKFILSGELLNRPGGTKLGRFGCDCTTISSTPGGPGDTHCTAIFALPDGLITTEGFGSLADLFAGRSVGFAITGGTGSYDGARGQGEVRIPDVNTTDALFKLVFSK